MYLFNPLRTKDVYIRPPCILRATTVYAFRAHQGRIYASLGVEKKSLFTQRVNVANLEAVFRHNKSQ